ncbi:hypothetical protein RCL1_003848 [Eukaryota sp. TZLM3-RCL]
MSTYTRSCSSRLSNLTPSVSSIHTEPLPAVDVFKSRVSAARTSFRSSTKQPVKTISEASLHGSTPFHSYFNKSLSSSSLNDTLLFHYTAGNTQNNRPATAGFSGTICPYKKELVRPTSTPLTSTHYRVAPRERCLGKSMCLDSSGRVWESKRAPAGDFSCSPHPYGPDPSKVYQPDHFYESKILDYQRRKYQNQRDFSIRSTPNRNSAQFELDIAPAVQEHITNRKIRPCCRPKSSSLVEKVASDYEKLGIVNLLPRSKPSIAVAVHPQRNREV